MDKIARILKSSNSVIVSSHIRPDGDAVGCTVAFSRAMKKMNKECWAISPSHIPFGFQFILENDNEVLRYTPERDDEKLRRADLFVLLDCPTLERAGEVGEKMKESGQPLLVIDHHSTNEGFGQYNYIKPDMSSTGEILMDLLDELELPLTSDLALPLYLSLVTDTGGFNYPATTEKTHRKAGRLLAAGVNPYEIHRRLALNHSLQFIRLAGLSIFNTNLACGGEVACSIVHNDLYQKFTPRIDELVELPHYLLSIRGVEVGALFLEDKPGRVIIELRSQGLIDVSEVAKKFGGGGHSGASGACAEGEIIKIVFQVFTEIEKLLLEAKVKGVSEELRSEVLSKT